MEQFIFSEKLIRKSMDPKERRLKFSEKMRPEAVEVWKEFSKMPDRARY